MYSIQFSVSNEELGLLCEIMTQRKEKLRMAFVAAKTAHANMDKDEVMAQAYGIYVERVERDLNMVRSLISKIESNL